MSAREQKRRSLELLDALYVERQRLNSAIYHLRRYVLGMNYKRAHRLIVEARALKGMNE